MAPWLALAVAAIAAKFWNARRQNRFRPDPAGTPLPDGSRWGALTSRANVVTDRAGIFASADRCGHHSYLRRSILITAQRHES